MLNYPPLFFQAIITVKSKAGLQLLVLSMEKEHKTVSMKPFTKVAIYIFIFSFPGLCMVTN